MRQHAIASARSQGAFRPDSTIQGGESSKIVMNGRLSEAQYTYGYRIIVEKSPLRSKPRLTGEQTAQACEMPVDNS
jgi:hypothetical protein